MTDQINDQNDQGQQDGEFNEFNKREEAQRKLELYNPTEFQMKWMQEKANEDTFGSWVHTRGTRKRGQGTLLLAWYNKDASFHSVHLGMKEVIATAGEAKASAGEQERYRQIEVYIETKKPGGSWNEKQVRFEVFKGMFALSTATFAPGKHRVTVRRLDDAIQYLNSVGIDHSEK